MCGRYTLTRADLGTIVELLGADLDPSAEPLARPRYNVAPSQACIAAGAGDARPRVEAAVWGLRLGGRFVVNLRSETAARYQSFRRCVVPADGFYEWTGAKNDRRPTWFHPSDGGLLLFAAVLDDRGGAPPSFAILTERARPPISEIHDRMPVIMAPEHARRWLAGHGAASSDDMALVASAASPRANSVNADDPSLLDAPPQLRLL